MPPLTDEQTRRNVIRDWISGIPRDTIAAQNNIGAGTVSSIIADYKAGLESLDFDSIRQLSVEARQHGLNLSELGSHARLYNYFRKSAAAEDKVESFITKVSSNNIPPETVIELVYQLYEISKVESIPLDQVSEHIKQELEQKQKIDEQIKEADAILQSKNVAIESINDYIKLNGELEKHGLSTDSIHKLLNVLRNAKRYGFDGKEIADKLYDFKFLEWKEKEFKDKRKKLSKRMSKYTNLIPFTEELASFGIGINELLALEIGIKEAAKYYNLPYVSAAMRPIDDIKTLN